jgi:molybdate transport system ATP-binding protein
MSAEISLRHTVGAFSLDVAFRFEAPGITALFGPSGAGKSTIIHAIAGLSRPEKGSIVIGGKCLLDTEAGIFVPARARRIGVVFQDARLFPHMTARNNLLYGRRRAPQDSSENAQGRGFDAVVELLGVEKLLDRRPRGMSGGERSRIALGRALLAKPDALLLDEPLAALDTARKAEILPYLERLRDETKIPMLYVSHSLDEVARLAERMIVISDGRVVTAGSVYEVASRLELGGHAELPLLGAILPARVTRHDAAHGLSELELIAAGAEGGRLLVPQLARAEGETVRVRIDAYDIMLARTRPSDVSANNVLPVGVVDVRADAEGPYADVQLALGEQRLVARITRYSVERLQLRPGMPLFAIIKTVTVGGREPPSRRD